MQALFLTLLAVALVTLAGREAVRVGRLSAALGQAPALLGAIWAGCLVLAGSAWLGARIAGTLHPDARLMMVAFALALAGGELWLLRAPPQPAEPTRSFGAIAVVLAAAQMTGSAGLLVFALAGLSGLPALAGAGGIAGAGMALTVPWAVAGDWDRHVPPRALRHAAASCLILAAILAGLRARGVL